MYAIVKTGGKQYRVQQGQSLLVERLPVADGELVSLQPLLYVDGPDVVDEAEGLSRVTVEARVLAHERGPKLRVVKFKPKRGYKRRTGHRQELTRIEVIGINAGSSVSAGAPARAAASAERAAPVPAAASAEADAPARAAASAESAAPAPAAASAEADAPARAAASAERTAPANVDLEATNGA